MSIKAPKLTGQGTVELPERVFSERFHEAVVWEAARAEQLAHRRGTAATRSRGQVRGGGAKPWRQKGTGRARAGSNRAPHWTGGGVVFGPTPRDYTVKVNRRARRRALRAALSLHAERGSIAIVDATAFREPDTAQAAAALEQGKAEWPVLVLLGDEEVVCAKSFRNIADVNVLAAADAGVADLLAAATVVASEEALSALERATTDRARGERAN